MNEFMFGLTFTKPTRAMAKKMNRICREAGGYGLTEINVRANSTRSVNYGRYQAWFTARNRGEPFNSALAAKVTEQLARIQQPKR